MYSPILFTAGLDSGEDPAESVSNPESHKLPANEDVRVKVAEAMRHVPELYCLSSFSLHSYLSYLSALVATAINLSSVSSGP